MIFLGLLQIEFLIISRFVFIVFILAILIPSCFNSACFVLFILPITPMRDQERISPYNINTISCIEVTRIEKNIN